MEKQEDENKKIDEKEVVEEDSGDNKETLTDKFRENPFMISTFVLGLLSIILIVMLVGGSSITGGVVSDKDIGAQLLDFYEANGATGLEFDSVDEISGVYQVNFLYNGQMVPIFATKDGKYAGSLSPLVMEDSADSAPQAQQPVDVVKSDKPVAELFVMTHCPYGTQAEKGFIPFMEAMGDSVDVKIRFVHYFMHDPEETETPRQVCIREEQSEKYLSYLREFLVEGDYESALAKAGIDVAAMEECISNGNAEKYYAEDSELSQSYGVQGSPTLVVNGAQASSGRDSASYLSTVCAAFNNAPSGCDLELSSASPSSMWGWDASGASATSAQC